jgi:hypothetical protein
MIFAGFISCFLETARKVVLKEAITNFSPIDHVQFATKPFEAEACLNNM